MLQQVGIRFDVPAQASMTDGFVVFPEDGSEPIVLPYPDGSRGIACEHESLVRLLRETAISERGIDFIPDRVHAVDDHRVTFTLDDREQSVTADLIVGADGQRSVVRRSLGLITKPTACSRMLGFELNGLSLPREGYGSIVCGGPGPIFVYRLSEQSIRVNVDIPLRFPPRQTTDLLLDSYAPVLPEEIRSEFREAVIERRYHSTANTLSPRTSYGTPRRVLIGDAAGHYHPMTAVGLTLGLDDAIAVTESADRREFEAGRFKAVRAPEMLALAFYEIMVDQRSEATALRRSVYQLWRSNHRVTEQAMRLLSCEDTSERSLGLVGARTVAQTVAATIPRSRSTREWRQAGSSVYSLAVRIGWFLRGVWLLRRGRATGEARKQQFLELMARGLPTSMRAKDPSNRPSARST